MIDKASRIVSKSNAERECRLRAPVFTVDTNKEVTRPLHWSGVMHSHLSSDQPHNNNVISNNNSGCGVHNGFLRSPALGTPVTGDVL